MHNEIILMKDVEWCFRQTETNHHTDVLLPSAKIINVNCNGVIIRNVIRIYLTYDGGIAIAYKKHPFALKPELTFWRTLPGNVPVNPTGGNITVRDIELLVETMSEFFIQIIDPTFLDHNVQTKIDIELRVQAFRASLTQENKRKFDQDELDRKRRWTAIIKDMGYKT